MTDTEIMTVRDAADYFLSATCTNRRARLTIKEGQPGSPAARQPGSPAVYKRPGAAFPAPGADTDTGGVTTSPASKASGSPWLARFVSLIFLMVACLALPQQAAAQNSIMFEDTGTMHTLSIADAEVMEGAGTADFVITVDPAIPDSVGWTVSYSAGTASLEDLGSPLRTGVFPIDTFTLQVPINNDNLVETEETFTVTLTRGIDSVSATGTITDNDTAAQNSITFDDRGTVRTLSIADAEVMEGADHARFVITVDPPVARDQLVATVNYSAGTASLEDLRSPLITRAFLTSEATLQVPINDDNLVETEETFTVTLTVTVGTNSVSVSATGTIIDDDTASSDPTVSIAPVTVAENVSGGVAVFRASLSRAATTGVQLNVAVTAGGGTNPVTLADDLGDLTDLSNNGVTIDLGDLSAEFTVPIIDDDLVEGTETFTVTITLRNNAAVTIGTGAVTGTITDDDTASSDPTVSIAPVTVAENVSGGGAVFRASLSRAAATGVQLNVAVTAGRGTNPVTLADDLGDLTDLSNNGVTIDLGDLSAEFTVPIIDDDLVEGTETFTVTITLRNNAAVTIGTGAVTGTITDDDTASSDPTVSIAPVTVAENVSGGVAVFRASLSRAATTGVQLNVAVTAGGGTNPVTLADDLGELPTRVDIDRGALSAEFTVPIIDDDLVEGTETFTVTITLRNNAAVTIGTGAVTGTITDDDTASSDPTVSIAARTVAENVSGGVAVFRASLSRAATTGVQLNVAVTAGRGTNPVTLADDLGELPTRVDIDRGALSADFTVPIIDDDLVEGNETFTVTITLRNNAPVTIGTGAVTGTITDDDRGRVSLSPPTVTAAENGTFEYTVSLDNAADEAVNITWTASAESGDTATVADDLQTPITGDLTFNPGEKDDQTFSIAVNDDGTLEPDETFTVTLSATGTLPTGVSIPTATRRSTATIIDTDDPLAARVSIANATAAENAVGGAVGFTVSLSRAVNSDVRLAVVYARGRMNPATPADDLGAARPTGVTIREGNLSATLTVPITNDGLVEGDETFTVTLREDPANRLPAGVTIGAGNEATGTITDDDRGLVSLSPAGPTEITEGGSFTYTVRLSAPVDEAIDLTWSALGILVGVDDEDLEETHGTVRFAANDNADKTFTIRPVEDRVDEPNETFTVYIFPTGPPSLFRPSPFREIGSLPAGVMIDPDRNSATATITDNDAPVMVRIADATVDEDMAGAAAVFTVSLDRAVDSDVTLVVTYGAGATDPATPADDLGADRPARVTIPADETSATVTVPILDDAIVEGAETFTVTVSEDPANRLPADVIITDNQATGTITEDDRARLSLSPARLLAAEGGMFRYTVRLSAPVGEAFDVGWFSGAGAGDVEETRGTVRFEANDTADRTFTIRPVADELDEPHETFTVAIAPGSVVPPPAGVRIDYDNYSSTATILDGSAGVWVSIADAGVDEDGGAAAFTVSLNRAVAGGVTLDVAYAAGSASLSDLLVGGPDRVSIEEGETSTTFLVPVANDGLVEGDETFTVTLSEARAYPLPADVIFLDRRATGTIRDDDTGLVSLSPTTAQDRTTITFRVNLTKRLPEDLALGWTATLTPESGPAEADPLSGTVTVRSSTSSAQFTIDAAGLTPGTLTVRLSDAGLPPGMLLDDSRAMTTHLLDHFRRVSIANADPVAEGAGPARFTVSLSRAVADDVWLLVAYEHRSASWRDLGNRLPASVLIAEGKTSAILSVPIIDDELVEGRESFTVTISEYPVNPLPAGVSIADGTATGTITDEGGPVSVLVSLSPSPTREGTVIVFGVDLTNPLEADLALDWTATVEPGADPRNDRDPFSGTVTVPEGDVSAPLMIDTAGLPPGRFLTVRLSDAGLPSGVLLDADRDASGDIIPPTPAGDTATVSLSPRVTEEETAVVFTVNLTDPLREDLALGWTATEIPESGVNPDQSDPLSGTVTVEAGDTSAGIMIDIRRLTVGATLVVRLSDAGLPPGVLLDADRDMTSYLIPGARLPETATVSLSPRVTEEGTAIIFTVNMSNPLTRDLAVGWTATEIPESGVNPDPGDPLSGTVTVEAGDISAGIMIDIRRLTVGATLLVRLSDAGLPPNVQIDPDRGMTSYLIPGARISSSASVAAVSIEDADPVAAGAGPARFMVSLSRSVDSDVVLDVDYGVSNGAGLASLSDLGSARPASVTITMGATEATLDVPIAVDDFAEDEETFTVTLTMNTAPDGVIIADGSATGTIAQSRSPSVLVEPRRVGAGAALRRHVSRFDSMTGTVVRNRLRGSGMHDLSFSAEVTEDRQDVTVSSQPFTGRWGTWIDGAWAGIDGNASGRQADIHGGVDYLGADGDWLIGALIGYELADLDIGEATFRSNTVQFGLYGGARLSEQLMFDGAFAYGTSTPEVGLDDVSGSYDAQRFTVRGALTGDFGLGTGQATGQGSSVRFEPQLGVLYSSEKLGAFTDSDDRMAKGETLEIGRLTAGPRVTRDFDGGQVTGGARIQWDFLGLDDGVDGRVSGAADVGLRLELTPGVTFGVHGDIDGIGIGDAFGSIGGRFELGARF